MKELDSVELIYGGEGSLEEPGGRRAHAYGVYLLLAGEGG